MGIDRHAQEVRDRHTGHGLRVLESKEQPQAGALVDLELEQVLPVERHRSLGDLVARVTHERVGERRLAGAVGAHERVDLALADREVQATDDFRSVSGDVQVLDDEVGHCRSTPEALGRCRRVAWGGAHPLSEGMVPHFTRSRAAWGGEPAVPGTRPRPTLAGRPYAGSRKAALVLNCRCYGLPVAVSRTLAS